MSYDSDICSDRQGEVSRRGLDFWPKRIGACGRFCLESVYQAIRMRTFAIGEVRHETPPTPAATFGTPAGSLEERQWPPSGGGSAGAGLPRYEP
jgi:hypothetical protein